MSHDVVLSVRVAVSQPDAYAAFTEPDQVSIWFTTRHEAEVVPGGSYKNADGDVGEYVRVSVPSLVEFTWDNKGHCPGSMVTVTFDAVGARETEVRLRHHELKSEAQVEDMTGGWSWALASFKSYAETGQPIKHDEWLSRPQ